MTQQFLPGAVDRLIATIESTPWEHQADTLIAFASDLGGDYTPPGKATHLHELTVYGVHARAEDAEALVKNWLVVARNQQGRPVSPALEVPLTATEIMIMRNRADEAITAKGVALLVIARPGAYDDATIAAACHTILTRQADLYDFSRATELLAAIRAKKPTDADLRQAVQS